MSQPPEMLDRLLEHFAAKLALCSRTDLQLRPEAHSDLEFLERLYASTRTDEMALVDWTDGQKQRFLAQQFKAQRAHYLQYYSDALLLIVEQAGTPVGRVYLDQGAAELRLMDIALLPEYRRQGLGRCILGALVALAVEQNREITLHVEPVNPALDWYVRLGFEKLEERGYYLFMRLPVAGLPQAQEKLT